MFRFILLILLVLCAHGVSAESTQDMVGSCQLLSETRVDQGRVQLPQDFSSGKCWGAFAVVQKVINAIDTDKRPIFGVCAPKESTRTQLIAVFVEYARRNPSRYHEDFFAVALASLQAAFPCSAAEVPQ